MFNLYDGVLGTVTGKDCFIVDIDDRGEEGLLYGLKAECQSDQDWFRWAKETELKKLPWRVVSEEELASLPVPD